MKFAAPHVAQTSSLPYRGFPIPRRLEIPRLHPLTPYPPMQPYGRPAAHDRLLEQARRHGPGAISIIDPGKAKDLHEARGTGTQVRCGREGLLKWATLPEVDIVLIASEGTAVLQPALASIRAGKGIAVASK